MSTPTSPQCLALINTVSPQLLTLGIDIAEIKSLAYYWKYALHCKHEMIQFSCIFIFVSVWGFLCSSVSVIIIFNLFLSTGTKQAELKSVC